MRRKDMGKHHSAPPTTSCSPLCPKEEGCQVPTSSLSPITPPQANPAWTTLPWSRDTLQDTLHRVSTRVVCFDRTQESPPVRSFRFY